MRQKLQLTLAIIKPHIVSNPPALTAIKRSILTSHFAIVRYKSVDLARGDAERFYAEHRGRFFYNRLVTFMCSGLSHMAILARRDAIQEWRKLMGPTKVFKTQFDHPDSIRGQFGLSDTRNAVHGSDSEDSVRTEAAMFFPEFDIGQWYETEGEHFLEGRVRYYEEECVHKVALDD